MRPSLMPPPPEPSLIKRQTERVLHFFEHVGVIWHMFVGSIRAGFRRPFEGRAILKQMDSLGVKSVGIVVVTSVFIGMVMAVQFAFGLQKFGGLEYTGRVIALSFARELAPTLTAVIVGGRIGSGMAAELGAMAVTEQIDAIRALGADPLKKLVWPRLLAFRNRAAGGGSFFVGARLRGRNDDHRSAIRHPGRVLLAQRARRGVDEMTLPPA